MSSPHRIAKDQLRTLITLARPTTVLITPDKHTRALVARGWCREWEGATAITPAGLSAARQARQQKGEG